MPFPEERPRRLRRSPLLRELVREVQLSPRQLILPLFVREGIEEPVEISTMPGVNQETMASVAALCEQAVAAGLGAVMIFGIPQTKDAKGSSAFDDGGVVQQALRAIRRAVGDRLLLITDTCLDEYTEHGHCGILDRRGEVDNDATLELYARTAASQAAAGADMVAPSGMMDGQVAAIRQELDRQGFSDTPILAYAAKFASCLYGPFRDAADCAPQFGDRRGYQMDPANRREALREVSLDAAEGADLLMVKPALAYMDVIREVRDGFDLPVGAYSVSGEYAMLKAGASAGAFDLRTAVLETHLGIRRAGADFILTYFARELCEWLGQLQ